MITNVFRAVRRLAAAAAFAAFAVAPAMAVDPLVTPAWLQSHRSDSGLVVLDIRSAVDGGGAAVYAQGHIPGAIHSDYGRAGWRVTRNNIPFMLPSVTQLEQLIGELGIDGNSHVVVVPAGVNYTDFGSAARVYWTLKIAGVANVSILDGGFAAWENANYDVERGVRQSTPKKFTVKLNKNLLAEVAEVEAIQRSGGATLVDARPPSFYLGKKKAPAAASFGHIPGAINLDSASFYDATTNRIKPKAELAAIAGALPAGPVVSYCNTGHWGAIDWFVLRELLGRNDVRLYDGSMVEWTANERRPVATSSTQ
jgi:thiosulfate/3-mercaptopyruvate sulfurtransferase